MNKMGLIVQSVSVSGQKAAQQIVALEWLILAPFERGFAHKVGQNCSVPRQPAIQ